MLSKWTVPLKGLSCWRHTDPRGHINPFPEPPADSRSLKSSELLGATQGSTSPVELSKYPPQNVSSFVNEASLLVGLSGSSQTHCLLRLSLKLCTPMMAKSSQKKETRKATRTSSGAAFFKLLRMICDAGQLIFKNRSG